MKVKKIFFEIIFATIIKVGEEIKNKKDLEKIILCDVSKRNLSRFRKSISRSTKQFWLSRHKI